MAIVTSLLQAFLFNLVEALSLAVTLGVMFRVFNYIVPLVNFKHNIERTKYGVILLIAVLIAYILLPLIRSLAI